MVKNTMLSLFKPEEVDVLTKDFRLSITPSQDRKFSIPSVDLLDEKKCLAYLDKVASIFQSSAQAATVSQFSKRYAFLTMSSGLYAMTMYNRGLNYSIENCHIESRYQGQSWLPDVHLINWEVVFPTDGDRYEWRDQMIKNIFAENIAKVWYSISKAAHIPTATLWENTAISVYWLYEKRMKEGASEKQKSRIHEDFQYLINEAPADLFGEIENPLKKFYTSKSKTPTSDLPIRIRKTCCLLYQVSENSPYCRTCPLKN